ncbi:uncharacterized protein A4U43_C05F20600 [Asparagus officinalis]|uniref:GDSL esterase/lipase n=1 Tax=Asparagus officinalis TaxID=4686 RepID=A0A5P1EXI3_ASPOF|nr:GDSL esterase/lipase At1g28600-like [Asparagus officinalis]ONK69221.1 uncharacterized protein A4U43_C05F20600 [Asparagus officinalis]
MSASSSSSLFRLFTIIITLSINLYTSTSCFTSIVSFGDSLTDTGNYLLSQAEPDGVVGHLPYGETYFHQPTGRFSDGRIILDFIAEAMGLPHVRPVLGGLRDRVFPHGVNFAVGGATAVESGFFSERGIEAGVNFSLDVQIEWFKQLLPSLCSFHCSDGSCDLSKTLFFVGEIGGNDYNVPFFEGKKLDEILTYVPRVIDAISSAIDELIGQGAKTLVVPSYLPVGCLSGFLTIYPDSTKDPKSGCVKWLNEFAELSQ